MSATGEAACRSPSSVDADTLSLPGCDVLDLSLAVAHSAPDTIPEATHPAPDPEAAHPAPEAAHSAHDPEAALSDPEAAHSEAAHSAPEAARSAPDTIPDPAHPAPEAAHSAPTRSAPGTPPMRTSQNIWQTFFDGRKPVFCETQERLTTEVRDPERLQCRDSNGAGKRRLQDLDLDGWSFPVPKFHRGPMKVVAAHDATESFQFNVVLNNIVDTNVACTCGFSECMRRCKPAVVTVERPSDLKTVLTIENAHTLVSIHDSENWVPPCRQGSL